MNLLMADVSYCQVDSRKSCLSSARCILKWPSNMPPFPRLADGQTDGSPLSKPLVVRHDPGRLAGTQGQWWMFGMRDKSTDAVGKWNVPESLERAQSHRTAEYVLFWDLHATAKVRPFFQVEQDTCKRIWYCTVLSSSSSGPHWQSHLLLCGSLCSLWLKFS